MSDLKNVNRISASGFENEMHTRNSGIFPAIAVFSSCLKQGPQECQLTKKKKIQPLYLLKWRL